MHLNRRHIIQFKPEGAANIFAPTIRINGQTMQIDNSPSASNEADYNHVNYPQQETVSSQRENLSYESMKTDNFNAMFFNMFSNLMQDETPTPTPTTTGQSTSYGLGNNNFQSDFAKHFASSLQSQVNCLNKGGSCTPMGECPPGKKIGECSLPAHVCCKSHTSPTAHGGSDNQQGVGDSYSNSVSGQGGYTQQELKSIYVDIKYTGKTFNTLTYSEKEIIKINTLDRYLNYARGNNFKITKNNRKENLTKQDILGVQIFQGSVVVRLTFSNRYDIPDIIRKINDSVRNDLKKLNIYLNRDRLFASALNSTTDSLYSSSRQTKPNTDITGTSNTKMPSIMGAENTFCQQFCGRELVDEKVDENGFVVPVESHYVWRTCSTGCKMNNCPNCVGPNYIEPGDTQRLVQKNYISEDDSGIKETNILTSYQKETKREDTDKCYLKTETECHDSNKCFFCVSDEVKNKRNCIKITATGEYICDQRGASACVPIYNQGSNLKTYNHDALYNYANYDFSEIQGEKIPELGDNNVLYYPYQGKCMAPIKNELSYEERRELMNKRYPSSRS